MKSNTKDQFTYSHFKFIIKRYEDTRDVLPPGLWVEEDGDDSELLQEKFEYYDSISRFYKQMVGLRLIDKIFNRRLAKAQAFSLISILPKDFLKYELMPFLI